MYEAEDQEQHVWQLSDYLRAVRERAWIIVAVVVVVAGLALGISASSTSLYKASSTLVYKTNTLDKTLFGAQVFSNTDEPRDLETAAQLVRVERVAAGVKEQLHSTRSTAELLNMITVTASIDANLVNIEAVGPDAQEAADIADAFAQQFIATRKAADKAVVAAARELVKEQLDGLSSSDASSEYGSMLRDNYERLQILESMQTGGFSEVGTAAAPLSPFSPRPARTGVIALIVGLVAGFGLVFLLDYFDRRIKDSKMLERVSGLPILALVPAADNHRWSSWRKQERSGDAIGFLSHPLMLESFRTLRSGLQYFNVKKNIKTILVTSGLPREGKTVTAINLSLSLTLAGNRVVLVESDLRQAMVASYLNIADDVGLSTVLATGLDYKLTLRSVDLKQLVPKNVWDQANETGSVRLDHRLHCLTSGPLPPNPAELLSSDLMNELLRDLSASTEIDYVVIDSPPVLPVADALILAPNVDAVMVVTRMNWSTQAETQDTCKRLRRSGARVIGVVASGVKMSTKGRHRSRGYYQYDYR